MAQRIKTVQESDLRMLGDLARSIQRVLPVTQADIDAAAALGKGWVVTRVFEVSDPLDNLRGGTQLVIRQNSILPGQSVRRVLIVSGPGGQTVVIRGTDYIVLPDAIANSLSYVKAFGGTEQNGTPTPDTSVDIVSNNGVIKYGQYGKNIWDNSAAQYIGQKYTVVVNDTGFIATAQDNTSGTSRVNCFLPSSLFKENTTYTISGIPTTRFAVGKASPDASTGFGYYKSASIDTYTFNITDIDDTQDWVDIYIYFGEQTGGAVFDCSQIQIEEGETVTPYEPYHFGIHTDGTVETINVHGKNLFNPAKAQLGDISTNTGLPTETTRRILSDFIAIKPNTKYTASGKFNINGEDVDVNRFIYAYYDANKGYVGNSRAATSAGVVTITTANDASYKYIRVVYFAATGTNASIANSRLQFEESSSATAYQPYYDGGTATAEMLLKVGDYQDVQSILDGVVTRNVGVKVLNGTENFETATATNCYSLTNTLGTGNFADRTIVCSHFASTSTLPGTGDRQGLAFIVNKGSEYTIAFGATTQFSTQALWQQFLADQYAAGTPVIVVYPLLTPTTESVAGQTLQVQSGDNTLEITQASLSGLELEAEYQAAVSLTIQEVQDANLDNNVTVTIQ